MVTIPASIAPFAEAFPGLYVSYAATLPGRDEWLYLLWITSGPGKHFCWENSDIVTHTG